MYLNMRLCVCFPMIVCHQSDASWGHMSSPGMFTFGNFSMTGRTAFVVYELVFFVVRANTSPRHTSTSYRKPLLPDNSSSRLFSAHTTTRPPMVPHGPLACFKLQAASSCDC